MESEAAITGDFRGAEGRAEILAAVASVAGFVTELGNVVAASPVACAGTEDDPLAAFADVCLDGLAVLRRVEAATAALKVRLVDGHVGAVVAMEDPASGPVWVKGREMAAVAEVACVLMIGERAAGALMASIVLYVAADRASAIWNRTTAIARGMQGPDESRTLTQLRPDIATELLLGGGFIPGDATPGDATEGEGPSSSESSADGSISGGYLKVGGAPAPRAQVLVMIPVLSLTGATDEPALLDGHGPIPASMARKLVVEGAESFYRVLVDPRHGAPLEIGRKSYRIPEAMRRWLRLRDGKCPFPGCSNNSFDNEADHLLAWQHGGSTGVSNLGQPCPKHHRMKHTSGWKPTPATLNEPPGWISPSGRYYRSEHQDWQPPHWPQWLPPTTNQCPGTL